MSAPKGIHGLPGQVCGAAFGHAGHVDVGQTVQPLLGLGLLVPTWVLAVGQIGTRLLANRKQRGYNTSVDKSPCCRTNRHTAPGEHAGNSEDITHL